MTRRHHQIEISQTGDTVWINSALDGSCLGRFAKRFGLDVHRSGTDQMQGKGECLYCTHEPAGPQEWDLFRAEMLKHHDVKIPANLITF